MSPVPPRIAAGNVRGDEDSAKESGVTDSEAVVLYAEFTARPGAAEAVDELLRAFARVVRVEPGNVVFDVYRRAASPDRFFVFEIYRDRAAFDEHLGAATGREFNDALRPLIVEDGSELSFLLPEARS